MVVTGALFRLFLSLFLVTLLSPVIATIDYYAAINCPYQGIPGHTAAGGVCQAGTHDCLFACWPDDALESYSCSCSGSTQDCDGSPMLAANQRGGCDGRKSTLGGTGSGSGCGSSSPAPYTVTTYPTCYVPPVLVDYCAQTMTVNTTYGNDCDGNSTCSTDFTSYQCTCNFGYAPVNNTAGTLLNYTVTRGCAPNECIFGTHDCDATTEVCVDLDGEETVRGVAWKCDCATGYNASVPVGNETSTCVDINECTTTDPLWQHDCGPNALCENRAGSFDCSCPPGFNYDAVTKGCDDIDECALGTHACTHPGALCNNTIPGYNCSCALPYLASNATEEDRGPAGPGSGPNGCYLPLGTACTSGLCWEHPSDAGINATCSVTTAPGASNVTLSCDCPDGYQGEGFNVVGGCRDENVCNGTVSCVDDAVCTPNPDGVTYSCPCVADSLGDGIKPALGGTGCPVTNQTCAGPGAPHCWFNASDPTGAGPNATCVDYSGFLSSGDPFTSFYCECPGNLTGSGTPGPGGCVPLPCSGLDCFTLVDECALGIDDCWDERRYALESAEYEVSKLTAKLNQMVAEGAPGSEITAVTAEVNEATSELDDVKSNPALRNVTCTDTPAMFTCGTCPPGMLATNDQRGPLGCVNITEAGPCLLGTHNCDPVAPATCLPGPVCRCPLDSLGDGVDKAAGGTGCPPIVNECAVAAANASLPHPCWEFYPGAPVAERAACTDLPAGYACACPSGWTGTGDPVAGGCVDIDECADPNNNLCTPTARICVNRNGTADCLCPAGSTWNGLACIYPPGTVAYSMVPATGTVSVGASVSISVAVSVGTPRALNLSFSSVPAGLVFSAGSMTFPPLAGTQVQTLSVSASVIGTFALQVAAGMSDPLDFTVAPAGPVVSFASVPAGSGFNWTLSTVPAWKRGRPAFVGEARQVELYYHVAGVRMPNPPILAVVSTRLDDALTSVANNALVQVIPTPTVDFPPTASSLSITVVLGSAGNVALNISSTDPGFSSPTELPRWVVSPRIKVTLPPATYDLFAGGDPVQVPFSIAAAPAIADMGPLTVTATISGGASGLTIAAAGATPPATATSSLTFDVSTTAAATASSWLASPEVEGTYTVTLKAGGTAAYMYDTDAIDGHSIIFKVHPAKAAITAVNPSTSPLGGGVAVTISGRLFADASGATFARSVTLAGVPCLIDSVTPTEIVCSPAATDAFRTGVVEVEVVDVAAGTPVTLSGLSFTFAPEPPRVTATMPARGAARGGTYVILYGHSFGDAAESGAAATFDGKPCATTNWISSQMLMCIGTPAGTPGSRVDVNVVLDDPPLAGPIAHDGFTYGLGCVCFDEGQALCVDDTPPGVCECEFGWGGSRCEDSVFTVSPAPGTNSDGGALVLAEGLAQPDSAQIEIIVRLPPVAASVDVVCTSTNPSQVALDSSRVTFTGVGPRSITALIAEDGLRDRDRRVMISCVAEAPGDVLFHGTRRQLEVVARDARIVVTSVEPEISALDGSAKPVTLFGSHFDPEATVYVRGKPATQVSFVRATSTKATTTTAAGAGAAAAAAAAAATRAAGNASSSPAVVTDRTDNIVALTFLTPAGEGGYADVTAANVFGGNGTLPRAIFYTNDCPTPGMYGVGNDCRPCPRGATCPGGNRLRPIKGYWNPGEDSGYVVECTMRSQPCLGWNDGAGQAICEPGYEGYMCMACSEGFVQETGDRCVPCPAQGASISLILADIVLWVLISISLWAIEDRENVAHVTAVVMALQTLAGTGKLLTGSMPTWMLQMYQAFKLFTSDLTFMKLGCQGDVPYVPNYFIQLGYFAGIWILLAVSTWVAGKVSVRCNKSRGDEVVELRRKHFSYRLRRSNLLAAWLMYLMALTTGLQTINCVKIGGEIRLAADPSVVCFRGLHIAAFSIALIITLACLAFPVWYVVYWEKLGERVLVDAEVVNSYDVAPEAFSYRWRHSYVCEFAISIALAMGDSFMANQALAQVIVLSTLFGGTALFVAVVRPHHRDWENATVAILNVANLLTTITVYLLDNGTLVEGATAVLVLVYAVAILLAVVMSVMVFVAVYNIFWKQVPTDVKLSYDIVIKGQEVSAEQALTSSFLDTRRRRMSIKMGVTADDLPDSADLPTTPRGSRLPLDGEEGASVALPILRSAVAKQGDGDGDGDDDSGGVMSMFSDLFGAALGAIGLGAATAAERADAITPAPIPAHWSGARPDDGAGHVLVDCTDALRESVQGLVDRTWNADLVGMGFDAKGKGHTHRAIRVEAVHRVENPVMWHRYASNAAHVKKLLVSRGERVVPVDDLATKDAAQALGSLLVDADCAETFLFHGTKETLAEAINSQGFDDRLARNGLFGHGIYFAESSSKSDEYAQPGTDGLCKIYLTRCVLGATFVTTEPLKGIKRPPCREGHAGVCPHPRHDSVLAQNGQGSLATLKYREIVIYDRNSVYPEFCITYRRV